MNKVITPGRQAMRLLRSARKLVRARRYAAALADIDQAVFLAPSAALYDYRGALLSLMGKVQEALESFTLALSLAISPEEQALIYFHRGLLHSREGLFDRALTDIARAQQLSPAIETYRMAKASVEIEKERTHRKAPVSAPIS